jgi:hypothetical protein
VVSFTPRSFTPGVGGGEARRTHSIGGWWSPTAGVEAVAKTKKKIITPAGSRTPVVQSVASSLYWLSYHDQQTASNFNNIPVRTWRQESEWKNIPWLLAAAGVKQTRKTPNWEHTCEYNGVNTLSTSRRLFHLHENIDFPCPICGSENQLWVLEATVQVSKTYADGHS